MDAVSIVAVVVLGLMLGFVVIALRGRVRAFVWPEDEATYTKPDEPVAIRRNLFEAEAEMMRGRLASEGIPCFVRGLRGDPVLGPINVELCVASRDAERALALLDGSD